MILNSRYLTLHAVVVQLVERPDVHRGGRRFESIKTIKFAVVVQLVERLLAKEKVAGSNPVCRSRIGTSL